MVEICAGSAVLSAEAQRRGFQVFPIDHAHNRFRAAAAILVVDMASPDARQLLPQLFAAVKPQWCHMGLPCGTCSRAREKPVHASLRSLGAPNPRPLRSPDQLFGISDLTPSESTRVQAANEVYMTAEVLMYHCFLLQIFISLENPERSWLWAILAILVKRRPDTAYHQWFFGLVDVSFDACMHGGNNPKATRLKSTPNLFETLGLKCDKSHAHATWKVRKTNGTWKFDTADEAVYPATLVRRMVECVVQQLPQGLLESSWRTFRFEALQQTGAQHRMQPPLIPEYASIDWLPAAPQAPPCKILETPWPTGDDNKGAEEAEAADSADSDKANHCSLFKIGFYFSPEAHVDLALRLEHPASLFNLVPDGLRRNIFILLTEGCHAMARRRIAYLQHMLELQKLLAGEEEALRKSMPEHVNEVTAGKPLCLFRRLLEETGFPDMEVCTIMERGVPLTGVEPNSPLYPKKYRAAQMTTEQLDHQATWRRKAMVGKTMTDEEKAQEADLEAETLSEVEAGFLRGPFSSEEISDLVGDSAWSLSKRFVLYQGEDKKIRVIDNYRDSGVNAAFGSSSYLALQDTDFIIGFLRFFMWVVGNDEEVVVPLTDGSVLRGTWHSTAKAKPSLLGRCVDLSKAYRQVAIASESLRHGVLGYQTEKEGWKYYTTRSLPFGASASVFAFNKVSRAIWHLLVHGMHILSSVFYDDYPCFELQPLTQLTAQTLDKFFNILGWRHAVTGKKATDFGQEMQALGVQYQLGSLWSGRIVVQNKPGRNDRILQLVSDLRERGPQMRATAASLGGLLNFCGGFVLGHSLKPATHSLAKWMAGERPTPAATDELCTLIEFLVQAARPREVSMEKDMRPVVVYTDGAFEDKLGSWGALILDPLTGERLVFHGIVPQILLDHWLETVGEQVICEVEMYAYLCVRWFFRRQWMARCGLCFIDNEACRLSLIKRSSPSVAMFLLICTISIIDTQSPFAAWMERVPSPANPADMPSRQRPDQLCELLGARDCGSIDLQASVLSFLMKCKFDPQLAEIVRFEAEID